MVTPRTSPLIHARSLAENVKFFSGKEPFSGEVAIAGGKLTGTAVTTVSGESLIHSAPLTNFAFSRSIMGGFGDYVVTLSLLLFAFSTAISWSYYGDRATTYLFGTEICNLLQD